MNPADRVDDHWYLMGVYFGFPSCCIKEFYEVKPENRVPKYRKFEGTGYIPCRYCHENVKEEEIVGYINKNRLHPEPFPFCGPNTYESVEEKKSIAREFLNGN